MLEEDQISFRSDSLMFDGVDDYSHQIADMIGLRSVSDFNQAGVSAISYFLKHSIYLNLYFFIVL